jgi:hypothetical protein
MPKARGGWNKYRAKKADCSHGHTHDSGREAARCNELHLLEKAGEILDLETQPQFYFEIDGKPLKHDNGRRIGYKADFLYTCAATQSRVVEDAKGFAARDWPIRKALFKALNPHLVLKVV